MHRIGVSYHKATGFFWQANPAKHDALLVLAVGRSAVPGGCGGGRKRLNALGTYCPDDHEYLDLRLSRDNINGQQFVNFLRLLRASHPETTKFILYLENAKYYHAAMVQQYVARHPEFHLEFLPAHSPNLNLIERLWKFLRKKAFAR